MVRKFFYQLPEVSHEHKKDHLAMKLWKSMELVETKQFLE
jgi:hypothetical protein